MATSAVLSLFSIPTIRMTSSQCESRSTASMLGICLVEQLGGSGSACVG
jgi:hypothetical protein